MGKGRHSVSRRLYGRVNTSGATALPLPLSPAREGACSLAALTDLRGRLRTFVGVWGRVSGRFRPQLRG
ncbi:putative araC family transcriptional regulator [Burkholderia mallei JHU]|nr:putative araC family transcriptional regulator [Burkholderia mallei JHU]